jgi:hypothetical protein
MGCDYVNEIKDRNVTQKRRGKMSGNLARTAAFAALALMTVSPAVASRIDKDALGNYFPAHDCWAMESPGSIQDRTREHLGSTDVVIIEVRKTLLKAIKTMEEGGEAPGLVRDQADSPFHDFLCIGTFIEDHEDGPSYCRRILGERKAAE